MKKHKSISCRTMIQPTYLISLWLHYLSFSWMNDASMWNAHSHDINLCGFHLWDTIGDKVWIILCQNENWRKTFSSKCMIFQDNNFTVCLETFFQDVRSAHKEKVDTPSVILHEPGCHTVPQKTGFSYSTMRNSTEPGLMIKYTLY